MQRALKHVPKSSWCAASSDFCNGYWPWKSASITWSCKTHVRFLILVQRVAIAIPPQRSDLRVLELSPKRPTPATLPTICQFTRHLWDIVRHCETLWDIVRHVQSSSIKLTQFLHPCVFPWFLVHFLRSICIQSVKSSQILSTSYRSANHARHWRIGCHSL